MAQFLRVTILTAITIAAVSGAGCSRVANTPSAVVADTTPPSVPGDVAANALSESAIDLSWSVSTDDTALSNYHVYRSAEFLASSDTANLSDDALETSTEYCYTVTAVDESGNESQQSASPACATTFAPPPPPRMNIVVVFTDDQRWDSLPQMPILQEKLFSKGVTFRNAYVPTPICLPSRATMFSGGFLAQNTDVLENRVPNGGVGRFNDS